MENPVMALAELIWAGSLFFGSGGVYALSNLVQRQNAKAVEPVKIDGRTQEEWYEILSGMTKDQYEDLSLGPLDGLERNQIYGWNAQKLVGASNYIKLMRGWYPERVCKHCAAFDCEVIHVKAKKVASTPKSDHQLDTKCYCGNCHTAPRPVKKVFWTTDSNVSYFEDDGDIKYHVTKLSGSNLIFIEAVCNGNKVSLYLYAFTFNEINANLKLAKNQLATVLDSNRNKENISLGPLYRSVRPYAEEHDKNHYYSMYQTKYSGGEWV
jgi:hypothetical protein